ncbi:hypothetical protein DNU06_00775 [Putridiphycobacter roseus]|uniref:Lipocalin-like domain-containing protein n=1 Tax=Putridiphycobacter roseus TaxID=2219161 RepID=A0A2W1NH26_9FLAO|nr:lipocalin family protein [Putridiphycobacter roseus]PZE18403.1 hypothetical protein DNU06_00775 [Putridiphycobacter roseus]
MKKTLIVMMSFAFVFTIASCNKNQKAVKNLDGSWKLVKVNGEAVEEDEAATYDFDNCKLKSEEYCDLTITEDGSVETATYKVTDDGEKLVLRADVGGVAFELESEITELTSTTLIFKTTFLEETSISELTKL